MNQLQEKRGSKYITVCVDAALHLDVPVKAAWHDVFLSLQAEMGRDNSICTRNRSVYGSTSVTTGLELEILTLFFTEDNPLGPRLCMLRPLSLKSASSHMRL